MKKVYVATFSQNNYGSVLQAVSLQYALREIGADPRILRIIDKDKSEEIRGLKKLYRAIKAYLWPEKHYGFVKKLRIFLERKEYADKRKKISDFCTENVDFNDIDLDDYTPTEDYENCIFLAGSDQVWNVIDREIQPLYKFSFLEGTDYKCFSYAASIGLDKLSDEQLNYYSKTLKHFDTISLREKSAVDLFARTALSDRIRQDVDPTFLHDAEFWSGFVSPKVPNTEYVFVYMLRPDKRLIKMALQLAQEKNLQVIFTGLYSYRNKHMYTDTTAGPQEFIGYIKNAEYVITNSFHGTCFSTIFHKKFISVSIASTGSRAAGLLDALGLQSHLVKDENDLSAIYEEIDYKEVDMRLNALREQSITYLKKITS